MVSHGRRLDLHQVIVHQLVGLACWSCLLVLLVGLAFFPVGHRGQAEARDARGAESETKFERQSIVVVRVVDVNGITREVP